MSAEGKGPWMTVIGVVRDVRQNSLSDEGGPELYRPYQQFLFSPFGTSLVLRTRSDPAALAAAVQRRIREISPEQPVNDVYPMPDVVWRSAAQPRFYTFLLAVFAVIALALAATGLYGVLSCTVNDRAREIGIRVALGATTRSILSSVVGHAMMVVFGGMVVGLAAAYSMGHLLSAQLYQVQPADALTYVLVCVVLLLVAALASWVPARTATRADPGVALRCD
jgi:predicted lysophospholipase L1 biosynthesis ABC-type transport system permease subunit